MIRWRPIFYRPCFGKWRLKFIEYELRPWRWSRVGLRTEVFEDVTRRPCLDPYARVNGFEPHPHFVEARVRGECSGYVLKAHCSDCGQRGTVDERALICFRCGEKHEITQAEVAQRDADRLSMMGVRRATQA